MINDPELSHEERAVIDALARVAAPLPPPSMPETFRRRLAAEVPTVIALRRRWPLAVAAALAVVCAGGWWWQWQENQQTVIELRLQLTTALNDLSDAKRFQAITTVGESKARDPMIVAALTTALLNDPNTNVRVAAVEALLQVADAETFAMASTQALQKEESVFVLAAFVASTEKLPRDVKASLLRALIANPHLTAQLRAQAESRIIS